LVQKIEIATDASKTTLPNGMYQKCSDMIAKTKTTKHSPKPNRHYCINEEIFPVNLFVQPRVLSPPDEKLYALMASRTTRAMHNRSTLHVETIVEDQNDNNSVLADSMVGHDESPRDESPDYLQAESLLEELPDLTQPVPQQIESTPSSQATTMSVDYSTASNVETHSQQQTSQRKMR
jgi:hypothetical protein